MKMYLSTSGCRLLAAALTAAGMLVAVSLYAPHSAHAQEACLDPEGACADPPPGELTSPVAVDDAVLAQAGRSTEFDVRANDVDPLGDLLILDGYAATQHGTITDLGDGRFRYIPYSNFSAMNGSAHGARNANGGCYTGALAIIVEAPAQVGPPPAPEPVPAPVPLPGPAPEPAPAPFPAPSPEPPAASPPRPAPASSCSLAHGKKDAYAAAVPSVNRVVGTNGNDVIRVYSRGVAVVDGRGGNDTICVTNRARIAVVRGGHGDGRIEVLGRTVSSAVAVDGSRGKDACATPGGAVKRGCER